MLIPHTRQHGFSIIAVTGALIIIGLLMMAALHMVQDHRRRATLSADRALALQEAETALTEAECQLAIATRTPGYAACRAPISNAHITEEDLVMLAGFTPGSCGNRKGLCWPLEGQSAQSLAKLLDTSTDAFVLRKLSTMGQRRPPQGARYVIEPIPDTQPGQWIQAGTASLPTLFRITAVGFGVDPGINVVLQTVYRPQANTQ
ncbi:pilus assembly PilX family protein [Ralstonia insidiosa]|uniref:pilus assembly PilX family protein n=1 Tax=Ralstonia insidiosa TaxID=190721 RepID=UPI000CEF13B0|nr:pilus assembly protein PilZ [Ralstonia insidiosa]